MSAVSLKSLLEAGAHFGHQTRRWNPKMRPYIFIERNGIHIIDLQKTVRLADKAHKAVKACAQRGEPVLFVGTKKQAKEVISDAATRCGMHYVNERWLGGMLTNFQTIRKSLDRLKNLQRSEEDGSMELLSKKERGRQMKEKAKLEKVLSGISAMEKLPGMIFVIDTKKEEIAIQEANKLGIPVIGVVDTNADPDLISFPIPGNDDAIRAIRLFAEMVASGVLEGREHALEGKEAARLAEEASKVEAKAKAKVAAQAAAATPEQTA
jgi:small subunit ribosomal protein S2